MLYKKGQHFKTIYNNVYLQTSTRPGGAPWSLCSGPWAQEMCPLSFRHSSWLWQLSFPHPGSRAATTQSVHMHMLHSCLVAGIKSIDRSMQPGPTAKPPRPRRNTACTPWCWCSAAGTGDSTPCQNPSPCNSDMCTSEGELHLVQGSGFRGSFSKDSMSNIIPGDLFRIFPNNSQASITARLQTESQVFPWKPKQNFFLFSLCISLG